MPAGAAAQEKTSVLSNAVSELPVKEAEREQWDAWSITSWFLCCSAGFRQSDYQKRHPGTLDANLTIIPNSFVYIGPILICVPNDAGK